MLRATAKAQAMTYCDTLTAYGFEWDGAVVRQSERSALYQAALDDLIARGLAFRCACTRKELERAPARHRRRTRLSRNVPQRNCVRVATVARGVCA